MPIYVNGQRVPEELVREEASRHAADPHFKGISESVVKNIQLRRTAEQSAIDRVLMTQAMAADKRPIDSAVLNREVLKLKEGAGCRPAFNDLKVRAQVEAQLRTQRIIEGFSNSSALLPMEAEVETFYRTHQQNFQLPARFTSAQIVLHVNEQQSEQQASDAIYVAMNELEAGVPFADVAERYSDCKGNGGMLEPYQAGEMVEEYERAVHSLTPGERTGVFTTPFGFHIAELRSKTIGGLAPFEEVCEDIRRVLLQMRQHGAYMEAVEALRRQAEIRFVAEHGAHPTAPGNGS